MDDLVTATRTRPMSPAVVSTRMTLRDCVAISVKEDLEPSSRREHHTSTTGTRSSTSRSRARRDRREESEPGRGPRGRHGQERRRRRRPERRVYVCPPAERRQAPPGEQEQEQGQEGQQMGQQEEQEEQERQGQQEGQQEGQQGDPCDWQQEPLRVELLQELEAGAAAVAAGTEDRDLARSVDRRLLYYRLQLQQRQADGTCRPVRPAGVATVAPTTCWTRQQ